MNVAEIIQILPKYGSKQIMIILSKSQEIGGFHDQNTAENFRKNVARKKWINWVY